MNKPRRGFTLIEVSLFLAVTGFIILGIFIGTGNSLYQQRYKDSVQSFAEFLRGVYSSVTDTEGIGDGRSDQAIYGKLVTFGEELNFDGQPNKEGAIFTYDVVGNIKGTFSTDGQGGNTILSQLLGLNANVIVTKTNPDNTKVLVPAGFYSSYTPKWESQIETTKKGQTFIGALLVVRSPKSGTVYTFTLFDDINYEGITVEVNKALKDNQNLNLNLNPLAEYLNTENLHYFKNQQIDFCVANTGMNVYNGLRQNIRLADNAHNASSVLMISLDDKDQNSGNKCEP